MTSTPSPRNIVLAGFMGSGKSTVGRELAALLGWRFVDLDTEIAREAGIPVADLFKVEGEAGFRRREATAIARFAGSAGLVLATGGGAVLTQANREVLHALGPVIYLRAPESLLWRRVAGSGRPLASSRPAFAELWAARRAVYEGLPYVIEVAGRSPAELAADIARRFVSGPSTIRVDLGERSYPIAIAPGALADLGTMLASAMATSQSPREPASGPGRCLVVSHPPIWRHYGEIVLGALREAGWKPAVALVPAGEPSKSLARARALYQELIAHRMERRDPVVAVGGGVVGDLAGFVAATYQRGVPFVQVPTTLLAQIDSSVGGKVAINLPEGKNLVGAFHQPSLVLADPLTLLSLPEREFASGLAELIKYGVIADAALFEAIERDLDRLRDRQVDVLVPLIARACAIKSQVVTADEREGGLRQILNFGHTLAHAVEAVAGYGKVLHGEAVAIGMVFAAQLAERLERCQPGLADRLERLLLRANLPISTELPPDHLLAAMAHDKKVANGQVTWILPDRLGAVAPVRGVANQLLEEVLRVAKAQHH